MFWTLEDIAQDTMARLAVTARVKLRRIAVATTAAKTFDPGIARHCTKFSIVPYKFVLHKTTLNKP